MTPKEKAYWLADKIVKQYPDALIAIEKETDKQGLTDYVLCLDKTLFSDKDFQRFFYGLYDVAMDKHILVDPRKMHRPTGKGLLGEPSVIIRASVIIAAVSLLFSVATLIVLLVHGIR